MDFSDQWKSVCSISSVFPSPLLLSHNSSSSSVGPLRFHPSTSRPTLLFTSPSLSPPLPLSLHPSFSRHSLHCFLVSHQTDFLPSSLANIVSIPPHSDTPISLNSLHVIRRPNSDLILFFPAGPNYDRLGYVVFSPAKQVIRAEKDADAFKSKTPLNHRILCISAVDAASHFPQSTAGNSVVTEGFLLCCTLYSIYWFKVESRALDDPTLLGMPRLLHLASAEFKACVSHACWNPHLQEESAVLLESGELRLFDLAPCFGTSRLPVKLRGTHIRIPKHDFAACSSSSGKGGWLACEFSWHPRILIVAFCTIVFLVDFRFEESSITVLAKIESSDSFQFNSLETDCFIAFCKSSFDDFYFAVATKYNLLLFDIRQPLMPLLKWDHNLNNPCCVSMYRLSELRPSRKDGVFRGASESGFAILAGSLWNGEFNIFCYGPPISAPRTSVTAKISGLCNSLYAWDLPSAISLTGCGCRCGNCLLRSDFSNSMLPVGVYWQTKKHMILGFLILPEDVSMPNSQQNTHESSGLGGFTLIRLMSSGKLELQRYQASGDFIKIKCENNESSFHSGNCVLYSSDQKENIATRIYYMKLDYLCGYLERNFSEILTSKKQNSVLNYAGDEGGTPTIFNNARELIEDRLKVVHVSPTGLHSATADILSCICFKTSIREIAFTRIWGRMQLDLLQMAFFKHTDLLMEHTDNCIEFADVPIFPPIQMPPFFLRNPSGRSERETCKEKESDTFVGPVLPFPVLYSIRQIRMTESISASAAETDCFSMQKELSSEVVGVANSLFSEEEICAVSLSCDNDQCFASQEEQSQRGFFLSEPKAPSDAITNSYEENSNSTRSPNKESNQEFTTFVDQTKIKSTFTSDARDKFCLGSFDDLSPVQLQFDSLEKDFCLEEIEVYKRFKRQYSKWQESYISYEDFYKSIKLPKA